MQLDSQRLYAKANTAAADAIRYRREGSYGLAGLRERDVEKLRHMARAWAKIEARQVYMPEAFTALPG